ncbi:DnaB-like helicase C-terminal domain-containing protein [uncultured Veillonella sp.]|uniref:DnaB-like helicase C-terminal domain-containing protein n=1 Tax=uncultured Veillonella sp. TaxID=159268 RepID=UPI00344E652E
MGTSTVIRSHLPCPTCGSSDALSEYSDGHTHCFSCGTTINTDDNFFNEKEFLHKYDSPNCIIKFISTSNVSDLPKRGITRKTCERYQYHKSMYHGKPVQVANYYNQDGELVGQKLRFADKTFCTIGNIGTTFFGQHLFNNESDKLIITEGEIDCLTVSQLFANRAQVVSLPTGAKGARKVMEANLKWLQKFEEVLILFDNDEAGRSALNDVKGILPSDKLKIVVLSQHKDPNEYLLADHGRELMEAIDNAKPYKPANIINGASLWKALEEEPEEAEGYDLPWDIKANDMTNGIRKGEIMLLTAGTGIGKSTMARELMYDLAMNKKLKVGIMMLEENTLRTAKGIMSIHVGKSLHISRQGLTDVQYKKAFDETLGTERFVLYDHFGSLQETELVESMRSMVVSEKCDFLVLDHISIAVSGIETKDERKMIDVLMTKLRSLVEETGVGMVAICHLKRTEGSNHEEGGIISLNHLRGSQSLAQLSDTIVALERNQQATDVKQKNLLKVRILKCRFTGDTGLGGYLYFDKGTNRLRVPEFDEETEQDEPREF